MYYINIKAMSRYRFVDFSLYKRTDELLRPSEMAHFVP